ncbi:peptide chain release factor N(5)-glutamine methyltransferase [uncultured Pseudoteredinibacter sp.]|uniref:peptide chain release factor N(5)-glutamine methyltransferase n=1 Tax=uncultured Pseudoteredinibacter sp. TaxID=1641701 RepID=UPI002625E392|nr:peptide chain release factor N(5)-glutamine methyltransferase [uncultured Pseudoteredinibacter sp.]
MNSIAELLNSARQQLLNSDTAQLDVELLLCHCLECERSYLFTWPEKQLSDQHNEHFQKLLERRIAGEPVAHIIAKRDFWDLTLEVNSSTLIPRPDTETLVEQALDYFPSGAAAALDLGTGTGAIALALASEWPSCKLLAVDLNAEAVALAERNRVANNIQNVRFLQSSWFAEIDPGSRFNLIVSNPPYIDPIDPHLQEGDVRFEPLSALIAGDGGMADLKLIVQQAPHYLDSGGYLLLEHGYQQAALVRELLSLQGFVDVASREDIAGHERISFARWP